LIYSLILYFFAKPASTHFVRLSASRTGLTQTFSTDPLLGSVGIFYFFVNSSKLDLLFNTLFFSPSLPALTSFGCLLPELD
jgi:hypothetical protein